MSNKEYNWASTSSTPELIHESWDTWEFYEMPDVRKFQDTVYHALSEVMSHAVGGHASTGDYNTFCNDAKHAEQILRKHNVRPVNDAVVERILDSGTT